MFKCKQINAFENMAKQKENENALSLAQCPAAPFAPSRGAFPLPSLSPPGSLGVAATHSGARLLGSLRRSRWSSEIQEERRRKKEEAPVIPSLSLETATVSDPLLEA